MSGEWLVEIKYNKLQQYWNRNSVSLPPQVSSFDYRDATARTTSANNRLHFELHFPGSTLGPDADGFYVAKSAFIWAHGAVGRACFGWFACRIRVAIAKTP